MSVVKRTYITIRQVAEWLNPDVNLNKKSKCCAASFVLLANGYYECELCRKAYQLLPRLYTRTYRLVVKAYECKQFGEGILDVGSGKNRALLVAEDILPELFESRMSAA